jgi:hypothetical protein
VIIHNNNNNETKTQVQINNDPELRNIQKWLEKTNKQSLNRQDLNIYSSLKNSPSQNNKNNYTPYLVGGGIGIGITLIVVVSYYLGKKNKSK